MKGDIVGFINFYFVCNDCLLVGVVYVDFEVNEYLIRKGVINKKL